MSTGLPDSAVKNSRHRISFGFQISNKMVVSERSMWYLTTLTEGRYWRGNDGWTFCGELGLPVSCTHTIFDLVLCLVQLVNHWLNGCSMDSQYELSDDQFKIPASFDSLTPFYSLTK